jgi:hypothetical protein
MTRIVPSSFSGPCTLLLLVLLTLSTGCTTEIATPAHGGEADGHLHAANLATSSSGSGGPPTVDQLTGRSTSPDRISAQLRLTLDDTGRAHIMNMQDVDRLQLLKLTFEPGELVDWHTHPGPVIVIVEEGVLTVGSARDCVARRYGPQEVYIEQGPGDILRVSNEDPETTVIYALFLEVPEEGPITIPEDDPGC